MKQGHGDLPPTGSADFRGVTAAALLKHVSSLRPAQGVNHFRGVTAAALLKPVVVVGRRRVLLDFRGVTAAALLKHGYENHPLEIEARFPRRHCRGPIEAISMGWFQ